MTLRLARRRPRCLRNPVNSKPRLVQSDVREPRRSHRGLTVTLESPRIVELAAEANQVNAWLAVADTHGQRGAAGRMNREEGVIPTSAWCCWVDESRGGCYFPPLG
jgi:hypothetical protein